MNKKLKIAVIAAHNGKDMGLGFDFSEVLNKKGELTEKYVFDRLKHICLSVVRTLALEKSCPIVLNK